MSAIGRSAVLCTKGGVFSAELASMCQCSASKHFLSYRLGKKGRTVRGDRLTVRLAHASLHSSVSALHLPA